MKSGTTALVGTGLVCTAFVAATLTGSAQNAPQKPAPVPAPVTTTAPVKPIARTAAVPPSAQTHTAVVKQYCVTCHSDRRKTGGLSLEAFDVAQAAEHAEIGEKMIVKLRAGMMPPPGARRPDAPILTNLVTALETTIDAAAAANPNPGVRPFQRLNRPEYARAIKDLLALDVDAGSWLPLDTKSANFDNIADAQALSPTLLESYLNAASAISRMAVGDRTATPTDAVYTNTSYVSQHAWDHVDGAPFGTRGGIVVSHVFPADAEYVFAVALNGGQGRATRTWTSRSMASASRSCPTNRSRRAAPTVAARSISAPSPSSSRPASARLRPHSSRSSKGRTRISFARTTGRTRAAETAAAASRTCRTFAIS
jgi:hypothetical protein